MRMITPPELPVKEVRRRIAVARKAAALSTMALSQRIYGGPANKNNIVWKMESGARGMDIEDLWAMGYALQGLNLLHETTAAEIVSYLMNVTDDLKMSAPDTSEEILDNPLRLDAPMGIFTRKEEAEAPSKRGAHGSSNATHASGRTAKGRPGHGPSTQMS